MPKDILNKIKEAGVVGAGGAGFPTHVKVSSKAKTIIVNGAECEPLLRVDQQLMSVKARQMVKSLKVLMEITEANEGMIALKGKYKDAINSLQKEIQDTRIRINILDDFYPAGDEHLTVYETTDRLVPQGAIPLKVDCVVINVETLINIEEAINGIPVTNTYLTVTGEVPKPITIKLPIGTPIKKALVIAGLTDFHNIKTIDGGPMMGRIVESLLQPITKTTKGLIVLREDHPLITKRLKPFNKITREAMVACIQCRFCTDLCPRYLLGHKLEPHIIMRSIKNINGHEETFKMAMTCSECGICEQYACIMDLSPRRVNAILKAELAKKGLRPDLPINQEASKLQKYRKIPVKRLISRLAISQYDKEAPLIEDEYKMEKVFIPLQQHVGAPSIPIAKVGQRVEKGSLIAVIPDKALGANIHASISGIIQEISSHIVISAGEGSESQ